MHFEKDFTYHIYNRSNEKIFRETENYRFFLKKIRIHISPYADILAYCLMPSHFHLLITVKENAVNFIEEEHRPVTQVLSKQIGVMLSSYSQAFNKKHKRKGSLFSHKTKAKLLNNFGNFRSINQKNYLLTCFNYIHQNPLIAGLVDQISEWDYSSYKDYAGLRDETIINKDVAVNMLNLDLSNFISNIIIEYKEEELKNIF